VVSLVRFSSTDKCSNLIERELDVSPSVFIVFAIVFVQLDESLIVPVVSLNVRRKYTELIDRHLKSEGHTDLYVTEASQGIRFRLDEAGAKLSSEAEFAIGAESEGPRHFVFDKPFLLHLNQKDSNAPYFAIWIETAEVLEKAPARP